MKFLISLGMLCGTAFTLDWYAASNVTPSLVTLGGTAIAAGIFTAIAFVVGDKLCCAIADRLPLSAQSKQDFRNVHRYSYLIFLVLFGGLWGLKLNSWLLVFIATGWLILQPVLLICANESRGLRELPQSVRWVMPLFFLSGFSALIYQIVWQRVMFVAFGMNIESVTLIVSIFMFGLGVGSLVGGQLSARFPNKLPLMFVLAECGIGLFGIFSILLIKVVSLNAMQGSSFVVASSVYALLSIPTLLMGATLPILVAYLHQHYRHVGRSVSNLYWINTIGAAMACFFVTELLFRITGQQAAVWLAAFLNILAGMLFYALVVRRNAGAAA